MARLLLVHGAAHGAWSWSRLIPHLTALGHEVTAIDLPSHGADPTPVHEVTLQDYTDAVLAALPEPAVVIGHSMAGYPISCAAEAAPDRVQRLIYLCAYVPWPGLSLTEMRKQAPRQPIMKAIQRSEDGLTLTFKPEHAREVFYADCSDEDFAYALENLCPQAIAPQAVPASLGANYARVPRSYIRCLQDNAIPEEFQARMAEDFAPGDRYVIDRSHSPFFSAPGELAGLIDRIVTPLAG